MNKCFESAIKTERKPAACERECEKRREKREKNESDNLDRNQAVDDLCVCMHGFVIENHYVEAII